MRGFLAKRPAGRQRRGGAPATRARPLLRVGRGVFTALALLLAAATAPAAEPVPAPVRDPAAAALPETESPRVCTPLGCVGAPSSPWTFGASFGAAVLAAVWLGRRRRVRSGAAIE